MQKWTSGITVQHRRNSTLTQFTFLRRMAIITPLFSARAAQRAFRRPLLAPPQIFPCVIRITRFNHNFNVLRFRKSTFFLLFASEPCNAAD